MRIRCAVVVPTQGRPQALRRAVAALLSQRYPAELIEVIIVDDGGSPPLSPAAFAPRAELSSGGTTTEARPRLRIVSSNGRGAAAARNTGARSVGNCQLLVFTDDDAVPPPTWIAELAAAHSRDPEAALGGPIAAVAPENRFSAAYCAIEEGVRSAHRRLGRTFLPAANLAVPAARFAELGGFDPGYAVSEDRDLCDRWDERGWPVHFVATALVAHSHPESLTEFWTTFFRYGKGAYRFHRNRSRRRPLLRGPWTSITSLVAAARRARQGPGLGLIALWQAATVSGLTVALGGELLRRATAAPSRPPSS